MSAVRSSSSDALLARSRNVAGSARSWSIVAMRDSAAAMRDSSSSWESDVWGPLRRGALLAAGLRSLGFLGLSAGGVVKPAMVAKMAKNPLILALANPTPEILPEEVRKVRDDVVMATGRSDYPNQVNNVLCFPYIFRGALDAGASTITDEMEIAAVYAIADLAQAEQSEVVAAAYSGETLACWFGVLHGES